MEMKNTLSMEMLAVGAKSDIGKVIEDFVVDFRRIIKENKRNEITGLLKRLIAQAYLTTGVKYSFILYPGFSPDGGMYTQIVFSGHSGTRFAKDDKNKVIVKAKDPIELETIIDLKNVKVSGGLAEDMVFTFHITEGVIDGSHDMTVRESTAIILHEIGHSFNTFMAIGDYVWLNYYLTDGIEILQGKKQNIYKLKLLDETWLEKNIPKEDMEEFVNNRDNDGITRKVILSAWKKAPRHFLTNNPITATKREEQLADMFPSRLGYGKDLINALFKYDRHYNNLDSGLSRYIGQSIYVLAKLFTAPLTSISAVIGSLPDEYDLNAKYDNPYERVMKVRRDLIMQLRTIKNPVVKATINDDIKAIDDLLKEFSNNRSVYDTVLEFFRPVRRRAIQNTTAEENLESLLNNDLFLQAYRLNN